MPSERVQRHIDALLDEADTALRERDWDVVRERTQAVLALDPANADAQELLAAAERMLVSGGHALETLAVSAAETFLSTTPPPATSFANGRYPVSRLLGEGGKKRVYLAHDTLLDRDVAFALIKTEGLDDAGRARVRREARAMGRLGSHPNIVAVLDLGEELGQPYLVTELMPGGDLTATLAGVPEHRLPLEQVIQLGQQLCRALEHAHARELIHRDLKPGNIWLSSDGTAKLGDFGLAVALDQTRHTQPGMMIGTVSYMAPEQAIGGIVDAWADLYALGCVLYELVCGRPPFVGEESVAIITQHLNTPPVHPSWHRPDCPAGLEALILRLLEKDPQKRPVSAREVLSAIQDTPPPMGLPPFDGGIEGGRETAAPDQNPLYQQTFVGREPELRQLQSAFDRAISGSGSLTMVVGEPGIGKTALCEQLATYVAVRGGLTLVGHCYEEGSLSLPYLPFVEALRSYVLERDQEPLQTQLGTGAADVARVVSEVRDRLHIDPRPASGDVDEDRWRLLQAVSSFLRSAASVQPLVLVLEDLHWTDRATLDLLQHLGRQLSGTRLLLVGTYRDVEVDRSHPLSGALADLRRSSAFERIPLRGLTVDEVHRMMNQIRGQEVSWSRAEAIYRQTEGNPLFVQEVLRYLVEEGLVVREGGRWIRADDGEPESGIPEGLRDVIGKRLSRLSSGSNQLLAVAAVIGREFRLDILEHVAGLSEEALYAALDEARDRAVVEERSALGGAVTYRFTHAFFRQTLYEELSAPRRIRMHQQVARSLEEIYARRLDEHAAELAEHFAHSSVPEDLEKAIQYGERAAQRAMSVYAYGEAARHLEQAVEVQAVLDSDDATKRCDLLLALGNALMPAGESIRVSDELAPEAFACAQRAADRAREARICVMAIEALHRGRGPQSIRTPAWAEWAERADAASQTGTPERAYADIALARVRIVSGQPEQGIALLRRALALAQKLQDPEMLATAVWQFIRNGLTFAHWQEAVALAKEFADVPRQGLSARTLGQLLEWCGFGVFVGGDRAHAERLWQEFSKIAEQNRDPFNRLNAMSYEAVIATLDGRLEHAATLGAHMRTLGEELGIPMVAHIFAGMRCGQALVYLGRLDELDGWFRDAKADDAMIFWARCKALRGEHDEARVMVGNFMARRVATTDNGSGRDFSNVNLPEAAYWFETAILCGDRSLAAELALQLSELPSSVAPIVVLNRHQGAAAILAGDFQKAQDQYRRAIEWCTHIQNRPEMAMTRLDLAELLFEHFPQQVAEAREHLEFAIGELQDMKMQPALERAFRRKLQLQGVSSLSPSTSVDAVSLAVDLERPNLRSQAAPDGTVTLMFTDIEDSTRLTVQLGDQQWLEALRAHHTLIRDHVRQHGGFEVKNQGDGFMLAFQSVRRALECAVAIQRALARQPSDPPIRVRMGLHTGEVIKDANDFHGRDVVLAARIADQARGGEILVSSIIKTLTEGRGGFQLDDGRDAQLKGLDRVHRMYAVLWE